MGFVQASNKNSQGIGGLYSGRHAVNLSPKVELCVERSQQCPSRRNVTVVTLGK